MRPACMPGVALAALLLAASAGTGSARLAQLDLSGADCFAFIDRFCFESSGTGKDAGGSLEYTIIFPHNMDHLSVIMFYDHSNSWDRVHNTQVRGDCSLGPKSRASGRARPNSRVRRIYDRCLFARLGAPRPPPCASRLPPCPPALPHAHRCQLWVRRPCAPRSTRWRAT